jgi:hypothetical protein
LISLEAVHELHTALCGTTGAGFFSILARFHENSHYELNFGPNPLGVGALESRCESAWVKAPVFF